MHKFCVYIKQQELSLVALRRERLKLRYKYKINLMLFPTIRNSEQHDLVVV